MKKALLVSLTILSCCSINYSSYSQVPFWLWAKTGVGYGIDNASAVSTDAFGNVYVGGSFTSSPISFDSVTLNNRGCTDVFLVKYDANGNVLWAKDAGGTINDFTNAITIDASGNCYITGNYDSPTITFDTITLTSGGGTDIYLAKYNPNGKVLWAKTMGAVGSYYARGLALDPSGNLYFTGYFNGAPMVFDSITLSNPGIFLTKYTPEGNVIWAKAPDSSKYSGAEGVAVDALGNSYITGYFNDRHLVFGNTTLINFGTLNIFLAKYDVDGNVQWAKSAEGPGYDYGEAVSLDAYGNCYIGGEFKFGGCKFGTINLTLSDTVNGTGLFLAKYDPEGNALWAKNGVGSYNDMATSLKVDAAGHICQAGEFNDDTLIFGTTKIANTVAYYTDVYVVKYDANGNVLWGINAGGTDSDLEEGMTVSIYIVGGFKSPFIDFGYNTITNYGLWNAYVAKYSDGTVGMTNLSSAQSLSLYPNPAKDKCNVQCAKCYIKSIEIFSLTGEKVYGGEFPAGAGDAVEVNLDFPAGVYFVRVTSDKSVEVGKIIKE